MALIEKVDDATPVSEVEEEKEEVEPENGKAEQKGLIAPDAPSFFPSLPFPCLRKPIRTWWDGSSSSARRRRRQRGVSRERTSEIVLAQEMSRGERPFIHG
jgi:hypothetical protein